MSSGHRRERVFDKSYNGEQEWRDNHSNFLSPPPLGGWWWGGEERISE